MTADILLALTLAAGAGDTGLVAPTALDEVKQLDGVLPDLLSNGAKAKALYATDAELRADFKGLGADVNAVVASVMNSRAVPPPPPPLFVAVDAVVEPVTMGASHKVVFFDGGGRSITVMVHARADHKLAVFGPAEVDERDLRKYTKQLFTDVKSAQDVGKVTGKKYDELSPGSVQHFMKKGGAWTAGPALAEPKETCGEHLNALAKALYVAEQTFFAENDRYAAKLEELDVGPDAVKSANVSIKKADAKSFLIEIGYAGGRGTISDKNDYKAVAACKDSP